MIVTIRTDKPEAEIGLYDKGQQVAYKTWLAHRELSVTIHRVIDEILESQGQTIHTIHGIIFFRGPGSFTGLRIGASVANAYSSACKVPITQADGENWIKNGIMALENGQQHVAQPDYGSEVFITKPRK